MLTEEAVLVMLTEERVTLIEDIVMSIVGNLQEVVTS